MPFSRKAGQVYVVLYVILDGLGKQNDGGCSSIRILTVANKNGFFGSQQGGGGPQRVACILYSVMSIKSSPASAWGIISRHETLGVEVGRDDYGSSYGGDYYRNFISSPRGEQRIPSPSIPPEAHSFSVDNEVMLLPAALCGV